MGIFVDAVHFAPHKLIDVQEMACDFLACSTYKFSGPHAGIMFGKKHLLDELKPFKLQASTELLPSSLNCQSNKWENGTQSIEIIAGIKASVEYIATLGIKAGLVKDVENTRQMLKIGYEAIHQHETEITKLFLRETSLIPDLTIVGITDISKVEERTPTFALEHKRFSYKELAAKLVERGVACGASNFYAINLPPVLGKEGFTRVGFYHYHTLEDVCKVIQALKDI